MSGLFITALKQKKVAQSLFARRFTSPLMKNLLTFIYRNERTPELEYEYKRVYKESKLNVLTTRVERTLTLTIDKSLIEKDKQEIKNYQNSKVAKS